MTIAILSITLFSCNKKSNNPLQDRIDWIVQSISGNVEPNVVTIDNVPEREVTLSFMIDGSNLRVSDQILSRPVSIVEDVNFYYVLDRAQHAIFKFDKNLNYRGKYGREGRGPGEFMTPTDLVTDGNHFYVYDTQNLRIQVLDKNFNYLYSFEGQPTPIGKNLELKNHLLYVHDRSIYKDKLIDVYETRSNNKIKELMPVIMMPGEQPLALNRIEFSTNNEGYLAIGYRALPYIFIYNPMMELEHVLHLGNLETREKADKIQTGESVYIKFGGERETI
ncbi:6-bladed beta-propeller, partial [Pleurocapsales cyanobacterium LEGE 10410]|nr:6-bladed beta-propeller [Pleurocapsales cyanobacterium LEGE 10410]